MIRSCLIKCSRPLLIALVVLFSAKMASAQRDAGAILLWDNLLQEYVNSQGVVNYKGLKEDKSFELCMSTFSNMHPDDSWEPEKALSFWINVYNAYTVKLIVDNYPVKSIKDIKDPWDKKIVKLGDEVYTLNQVENEIIRPQFNDPRIHFAINCAAASCPKLQNRAFFPMTLSKMLDQVTKDFITNERFNTISKDEVAISKIFEWYASDFNGIAQFLNRYSDYRISPSQEINYKEYDWSLNGK